MWESILLCFIALQPRQLGLSSTWTSSTPTCQLLSRTIPIYRYRIRVVPLTVLSLYPQVCQAAVGLVGDLCRGLGDQLLKYCTDIMTIMVETLSVSHQYRPHPHFSCHVPSYRTPWSTEWSNLPSYLLLETLRWQLEQSSSNMLTLY